LFGGPFLDGPFGGLVAPIKILPLIFPFEDPLKAQRVAPTS